MICSNYSSLTPLQKVEFIGKLVHSVQNNNICFIAAKMIIQSAEESGDFEGVIINPELNAEKEINSESISPDVI